MEEIRFSRDAAVSVVNAITQCSDILNNENQKIQQNFEALGDTFKDSYYQEYKQAFDRGNSAVRNTRTSMKELSRALLKYAIELTEELRIRQNG